MESMMAYCSTTKFEDTSEAPTFLSSTFIDDFAFSTAACELYSNINDDITNNDATNLKSRDLIEKELINELEDSRKKIKRLETDLNYHRQHIDTIAEEHSELSKSLNEYKVQLRKKDEKLEILNKTVNSLKCELESFYHTDTSANETTSSVSELHGTISYSSDSANNIQVSSCTVETKAVEPKKEGDVPDCDVLKEFITKYNESLEEIFKLKEEVSRLNKVIVDLKDIISYRDQMVSTNCSHTSSPSLSTPIPTLADELSIENQEMPSVIMKAGNLDLSYENLVFHTTFNVPSEEKSNNENDKAPSEEKNNNENKEKVPLDRKKCMYFVLITFIALICKGILMLEPTIKLESELKPYYTIQEITSDFFNLLALYF